MDMNSINWLAVLVAGISAFVLGGVWYSPLLFGKAWMSENKLTEEDVKKGNATKIYGWAFVLSLIMAANLAMFLADTPEEASKVVDRIAAEGWAAVKSYSMLDEPTYLALAAAATEPRHCRHWPSTRHTCPPPPPPRRLPMEEIIIIIVSL